MHRLGRQIADEQQRQAVCQGQLRVSEELRKNFEAVDTKSVDHMQQTNNYTDKDADIRQQLNDTKLDLEASKQQVAQLLREHEHCRERASEKSSFLEDRNKSLVQENQALQTRVKRLESEVDMERDEKQIQHEELQKQFEDVCNQRDRQHERHQETQTEVEFLEGRNNSRQGLWKPCRAQSNSPIFPPRRLYTPPNPYEFAEYSLLGEDEGESSMDDDDQLP